MENTQEIMSNTIRIEKFNGKNNFNLWCIKMRALLKEQHVWAPIASASVKKEVASESKEKASVSKIEELAKQEEKAHSLILLSLSDEVLYEVANEETANGLWLKLEKLFMTKSICDKLFLKRDIDVKIEDEDVAMILLASLPPSYESFVNSLSVGKEYVTMEEVKSSLYSRELRSKASGNFEESNGFGLVVSNSIKNIKKKVFKGKKKTHVNPKDICNYCKEPGHWKKDCPKKKGKPFVVVAKEGEPSWYGTSSSTSSNSMRPLGFVLITTHQPCLPVCVVGYWT
ncbi:Retrovirus-related Pol polyprotein from transposon TNT 1-94 [Glycine soja]